MDNNNPKKSKAFIITFILILILLVAGYYFFKNREQYFGAKGSLSVSKVFSPLLGSSKGKDVKVIDTTPTTPAVVTTPAVKKKTGVVITDVNGNRVVRAEAGENLKKGDVLYIAGFNKNDEPIVMKAIANDKNKSLVFGVAGQDMAKGEMLDVIIEGILNGIPTNRKEGTLWATNNPLYLSDKIYGGMTKNAPKLPSFTILVGSVIKVHAINGSIRIGELANNKDMSALQRNTLNSLNTKLLNLLSTNTNLSDAQKNNIRNLSAQILGSLNNNKSLSNGLMNMINNLNAQILNDIPMDMLDYWSSIFGPISFNTSTPSTPGTPALNPITLPDQTTSTSTTPNTNTGTPADTGNGTNNPITPTVEVNSCQLIEKNPLVFTEDEKARLAVLLRKFYLISSTLRTAEDLTTLNNEIDQNKNFISQIEGLTNQCTKEIDDKGLMALHNGSTLDPNSNPSTNYPKWVRHGNPWYTKTTGGIFPYTDQKTGYGYLDYNQLDGGMTPAGLKVVSGYYYGTTSDGLDCAQSNNFAGYGLMNQINNIKNIYTGKYFVSSNKSTTIGSIFGFVGTIVGSIVDNKNDHYEANSGGFPGDSLESYNDGGLDRRLPRKEILEAGCSWKDGVILDNTERILNIW